MPSVSLRSRPILPLLVGLAFLVPIGASAAPPADPAAVVNAFVADLGRMSSDQSLNASDRERAFSHILATDCDVSRIANYALGSYFASAGTDERQAYDTLFERWVTHVFAERLGGFTSASFNVTGTAPAKDSADKIVSSTISDDGRPVHIDWRVSSGASGYRIVDVAMEGISMAVVEREEIGDVLRRNGGTVAGLNHALEAKLTENASAPSRGSAQLTSTSSH
ncbi:MAG TPA: ABC transporter substrate-binding protein [Stellaceae bacterium]|nr:ABC transporter substrate-binding protein [Stellaceae bacterium]